jgi:mannopine transport system substrate-binding protein
MTNSRREVLLGSLGAGTVLAGTWGAGLGPLSQALAQTPKAVLEDSLIIRTTGGIFEAALKKNFFDPFTKATGVKVVPVAASYGDMMAKSAAMQAAGNVEWDIISPQFYELSKLSHLLEDLGDCSAMPNVAKDGIPSACGRYGVLYLVGGQVLAYDPEKFKGEKPKTWADFWDVTKFPGPRALPNTGSPWATLIAALIADGVAPDKLFPLDLDRAFAKLDKIKPHVAVWWKTGAQSQQVMRQGDAVMTLMWSGTAYATEKAGVSLDWSWTNAVADFGAWGILKGAPHPKAARAFIDFYIANPENHAAFSREMGYATSNKASQALLNDAEKAELGAIPEVTSQIISPDADWLEKNRAAALERWNRWVAT